MMMVEVTQADRDSAKILYPEIHEQIKVGCIDHWPEVQTFAAHRIQSTADLQAKLDKAVEAFSEAMEENERLKEALWDSVDKATKMQGNEK